MTKTISADREISRLNKAISKVKWEITQIQNSPQTTKTKDHSSEFNIHLLILNDYDLINQMKSRIYYEQNNAERAWSNVAKKYISMFEQINTDYMKNRVQAIRYVTKRVLLQLAATTISNQEMISKDAVLNTEDITTMDIAQF